MIFKTESGQVGIEKNTGKRVRFGYPLGTGEQKLILIEAFCLARLGGCGKENKVAQTSRELFSW